MNRVAPDEPSDSLHPPVRRDEQGRVRRVGVELELQSLSATETAQIVAAAIGGTMCVENEYLVTVATPLGPFRVEADLQLLRTIGERQSREEGGWRSTLRDAMAAVAEEIAPFEVVAPPIPYTEIGRLDALVVALRDQGATGTKEGVLAALGLQLNPRVPSLEPESILRHIRAYAVLAPFLRRDRGVDLSRRAARFVAPYPVTYLKRLLAQREAPSMRELCAQYLEHNATRNRALDMLPFFSHVVPDEVARVVDDPRVKSRPTFHYRLPDSRLDLPDWTITAEWRRWLLVERLAADRPRLEAMCEAYLELMSGIWTTRAEREWAGRCSGYL